MSVSFPAKTANLVTDGLADGTVVVTGAANIPAGAALTISSKGAASRSAIVLSKTGGDALVLGNPQTGKAMDCQAYRAADAAVLTMPAQSLASGVPAKVTAPTGSTSDICGIATLVGGSVTVATKAVAAGSVIIYARATTGGTLGNLSAPVASIVAGTSFVINSDSGTETSTVFWNLIN